MKEPLGKKLKVAIVHDWLVTYRGGEKVLEQLLELFPKAPVYTLFYDPRALPRTITARTIIVPKAFNKLKAFRKLLLPFYPSLIESFDMNGFDLVISSSSCVAKGIIVPPHGKHICYLHSPMRYLWDQRQHYLAELKHIPFSNFFIEAISPYLRMWDQTSNNGVDVFLANSRFVASRIARFYRRDSEVVHPPVDLERFKPEANGPRQSSERKYFLACGAMVSYKRFDLAIEACEALKVPLIIAGSGPMFKKLQKKASHMVQVINAPSNEKMVEMMRGAKALIFPGTEDFGLVPVEALACGTPIIAFRSGGALDYVVEGKTGVFFNEQNVNALKVTIEKFATLTFDYLELVKFAQRFSPLVFREQISAQISQLMGQSP